MGQTETQQTGGQDGGGGTGSDSGGGSDIESWEEAQHVATASWLSDNIDDVTVVDASPVDGTGYIDGAVGLDAGQTRGAPATPLHFEVNGIMKRPDDLAEVFGQNGISETDDVVVYDEFGGLWAATVVKSFIWAGHEGDVKLFEGNRTYWVEEGGATSESLAEPSEADYSHNGPAEDLIVTGVDVMRHLNDDSAVFVDNRDFVEYTGTEVRRHGGPSGSREGMNHRGGHIPGAELLPWRRLLTDPDNDELTTVGTSEIIRSPAHLRPVDEVSSELGELGISRDQTVISYCQTAVRGALPLPLLTDMGYNVRVYEGAYEEWGGNQITPITDLPPGGGWAYERAEEYGGFPGGEDYGVEQSSYGSDELLEILYDSLEPGT
ncbi:MAG: rhodanese-like domain-containing protein [Halobacteria archaeon]|nr:rhodanese-like domain-containing protein [Halobacteria archaeon]